MNIFTLFIITIILIAMVSYYNKRSESLQSHPAIHGINALELKDSIRMDDNIQLIDVRTAREFSSGFIKRAINIDFMAKNFKNKFDAFDKEQAIYLYCRIGRRSRKAALLLAEEGFKQIYDLEGGIMKWPNSMN